jgi:hypothetical protein
VTAARAAELSDRELRLLRLRAQGLLDETRGDSLAAAVKGALAIQAQDVVNGLLGVRARTTLTRDAAISQSRRPAVCRSWLMRNTLFMFATRDLAWMRPALSERPLRPAAVRFGQLGMPPAEVDRVMDVLRRRLAEGPLPRPEARGLLISEGVDPGDDNARIYWTIGVAALRGVLVIRPALEQVQTFVAAPEPEDLPREQALGRIARRFIAGHGPATIDDLAYWLKCSKADARTGWENAGRTVEVETERGPMTALPGTLDPPAPGAPAVRLLGQWDHWLLSWADKGLVLPDHQRDVRLVSGRRTAYADGRAFATWRTEKKAASTTVVVEPFDGVPRGARAGLEAEAADLGRFYGVEAELRIER